MKKIVTGLAVLLLSTSAMISQAQKVNFREAGKAELEAVRAAGRKCMAEYLNKIPAGAESKYGFNSREEFKTAELGAPFQMLVFDSASLSDNKSTDATLVSNGEYRLPIIINGEFRAMLTVALMKGNWRAVGLGAMGMSGELGEMMKIHQLSGAYGIILRVYRFKCDFYIPSTNGSSIQAYPLASARMAFDKSIGTADRPHSLSEILSLIKQKAFKK